LTVRIVEGQLYVCAVDAESLPGDEAPLHRESLRRVPVLLDDGRTGHWAGAPVAGSLRLVDWLCTKHPAVEPVVAAIAALIVEAAELTTRGELVPSAAGDQEPAWRPAPGVETVRRLDDLWSSAADAVDDGDPEVVLGDWFATTVAELAAARVGSPPTPSLRSRTPLRLWSDQVVARAAAGARVRFHLNAPDDSSGYFMLSTRCESIDDTTIVVSPFAPDAAALLGCANKHLLELLASEWAPARGGGPTLPERPAEELMISPDEVGDLIEEGAGALALVGIAVHLPSSLLARTTMVRRMVVAGHSAGLDARSLALTGEVLIDGDPLTAAELDALANARTELVAVRGKWLRISDADRDATEEFRRRVAEGTVSAADVLDVAAIADEIDTQATSGWLSRAVAGQFVPTHAERVDVPASVVLPLRHYQQDGLSWLVWLETNGLGGVLADDMGLGKSATVLALLAHEAEQPEKPPSPTLIVAPTSVVSNWLREVEKFVPGLRVVLHHGSARRDPAEYVGNVDIVVTSYGVLRRDEQLTAMEWHRVVLDEAQAIKNPATAISRAVRRLTATHRLAVTGTPVENHLGELWSLMAFAIPGLLGTQSAFKSRYGDPQNEASLAGLRTRVAPFVLRRHKTDPGIADELPERIIVRDDCSLTPEQAGLYQAVVKDMTNQAADAVGIARRGKVLAGITRLKQICNHPTTVIADDPKGLSGRSGKLDRLVTLTEEIVAEGEAVVIFSQYATFLRRVAQHLREELEIGVEVLDGKMSRKARDAAVERFSREDGPPALCVSLRAGGTGLNLIRANHVIHFDRWWNPAVEDQASDRVWRIGQTRGVVVHTMVCPGTFEERIADLLDAKRELAGSIVTSSPEQLITELDDAALAALLQLDVERAEGIS
jgi:superfamily II DNA or RNA helicase